MSRNGAPMTNTCSPSGPRGSANVVTFVEPAKKPSTRASPPPMLRRECGAMAGTTASCPSLEQISRTMLGMEKRPYRMQARAKKQEETRRRIVEATVDLHSTVGPARTTISAIATAAGVQRHTVYAHFPDEIALFRACTTHWRAVHPFPSLETWAAAG